MEILSLPALTPVPAPAASVVALGFFDGVHTAHAAVLAKAAAVAAARGLPLLLFTFSAADAPKGAPLLSGDEERAALFFAAGATHVVFAPFSALADMAPEAFVAYLVDKAHVGVAVTGENFRFGRGAVGDAPLLARLMRAHGGEAYAVPSQCFEGAPISSSRIRRALADGDCRLATALLGRPYALTMPVTHGRHLGHVLGFPTANFRPPARRALPAFGVYGTEVTLPDGRILRGVTDVGRRPTVRGEEVRVETHILDYSGDLYGSMLTVAFLGRVREERCFSSLSALTEQIKRDCEEVRAWKQQNGPS